MQCLEVSGAVRLIYKSLGVKGLIIFPFVDVLRLYTLQDKTVLCYIHTLQNQVPSTDVLGMCNF